MKLITRLIASAVMIASLQAPGSAFAETAGAETASAPFAILVHGGAGAMERGRYTPEQEAAYHETLTMALDAGYAVLEAGGPALDAVEAAIVVLEDSPLFNAGRGAVFTREGEIELDASIMDGASLNAGAVAGVARVKNPVRLARAVMEKSEHVMLIGAGAEKFAKAQGIESAPRSYFRTDARKRQYEQLKKAAEEKEAAREKKTGLAPARKGEKKAEKYGTVGAVALDASGDLAGATSTGGMVMKRFGRVGDVPVIGAGVFADNRSCAVSSTGWGEYFIRLTVARDICAQVEYAGKTIEEAADDVIHGRLETLGGDGGVIVLGPDGQYTMKFNSKGMFRGVRQSGRPAETAIYSVG